METRLVCVFDFLLGKEMKSRVKEAAEIAGATERCRPGQCVCVTSSGEEKWMTGIRRRQREHEQGED